MTNTLSEPTKESPPGRAVRWGKGKRADLTSAQQTLMDAAHSCYIEQGVAKTTVEDVARAAKVSRTTVYRYYKNRDEVLTAVVLREASQGIEDIERQFSDIPELDKFMVEVILHVWREAPNFPLSAQLLGEDSSDIINRLLISSAAVFEMVYTLVEPHFHYSQSQGKIRDGVELPLLLEWTVRMIGSYLAQPESLAATEEQQRHMLETLLVAGIMK